MSVFNKKFVDVLQQPMFLGEDLNTARYDQQTHPIFEKLIDKQLSFFWRPEEVDLTADRKDFEELEENQKHIFISNLKYQTLLDSVQGRSPNLAYLPIVSLPELETWIETYAFSETIHSRSYTHIIRNVFNDPSKVLDEIVTTPEVVERAQGVTLYYDKLIDEITLYKHHQLTKGDEPYDLTNIRKALYLSLVNSYILEGVRFYTSFACSFAFGENKQMEGNAKIIKLIARDESLHCTGVMHKIMIMRNDPAYKDIIDQCDHEAVIQQMFIQAAKEEKAWAKYLFKDGSMLGLNTKILTQYTQYLIDQRLKSLNFEPVYGEDNNPLPWMENWTSNDSVQVAPQETEISSYLVGAIDSNVEASDFDDFEL